MKRLTLSALSALCVLAAFGTSAAAAQAQWVIQPATSPTYLKETIGSVSLLVKGPNHYCEKKGSSSSGPYTGKTIPALAISASFTCSGNYDVWQMNGCSEVITPTSSKTGSFSITCPAGKEIEITNFYMKCTIYLPAQTPPTQSVSLSQEGLSIYVSNDLQGIVYRTTGGACGEGAKNGLLSTRYRISGYTDAALTKQQKIAIAEVP